MFFNIKQNINLKLRIVIIVYLLINQKYKFNTLYIKNQENSKLLLNLLKNKV